MSAEIIDLNGRYALQQSVAAIDLDFDELEALWRFYGHCSMSDQREAEHKLGAVSRFHQPPFGGRMTALGCMMRIFGLHF